MLPIWTTMLLGCTQVDPAAGDPRTIRDVTELQRIRVERAARPHSAAEVQELLRAHDGPISIGGGRFSMGGQVANPDTLHLDLREMNDVLGFDAQGKSITVEAGATWRDIQEHVDPHDLSVKIMQSYANFTVGGSLSVNGHGRYVNRGPVVNSVQQLELVLADGERVVASRDERPELFFGAIGGYGALGVITSVTLDLEANDRLERQVAFMPAADYRDWFEANIRGSREAVFHNADLYTTDYEDVVAITYARTDAPLTETQRLQPGGDSSFFDKLLYWAVSELPGGLAFRQSWYDPQRLAVPLVLNRNFEASWDVASLNPWSRRKQTYVLQEYFVPIDALDTFRPQMAEIFERYDVNVLNVSIRHATADPDTLMSWAPVESYAYVVYYKQGTDRLDRTKVGLWTRELVDAVLDVGGTYYLPYQPHPTPEQFHAAYPRARELLALKEELDPDYRFRGRLWDTYAPPPPMGDLSPAVVEHLRELDGYLQREDQTFLTLPEWWIVYEADQLGAFLIRGESPSAYPYWASMGQLIDTYRRISDVVDGRYPHNADYHLMIRVITASFVAEYTLKGLWEGTVGALTETIGGHDTAEDQFYGEYTADYGAFLHHTPWYAFDYVERRAQLNQLPWTWSLRGVERRTAVWTELTAKAWWGWAMGLATQSALPTAAQTVYAVARTDAETVEAVPDVHVEEVLEDGLLLLRIPRYEPFTAAIPAIGAAGIPLVEIAGNETVLVTVLADAAWDDARMWGTELGRWPLLGTPGRTRIAVEMPVRRLHEDLPRLLADASLEHVYDY